MCQIQRHKYHNMTLHDSSGTLELNIDLIAAHYYFTTMSDGRNSVWAPHVTQVTLGPKEVVYLFWTWVTWIIQSDTCITGLWSQGCILSPTDLIRVFPI